MNAFQNYHNMDMMIDYMNKNYAHKYKFQYSTPSDYIDALQQMNRTWTTKYDDLFPYADCPQSYWTGYFSSRAGAKSNVRRGSHLLHSNMHFQTLASMEEGADLDKIMGQKELMLDAMGIYQHHDAVSGTARQDVADDYDKRLNAAMDNINSNYGELLNKMIKSDSANWTVTCSQDLLAFQECPPSGNFGQKPYFMAVHNPSSVDINLAELDIDSGKYKVAVHQDGEYKDLKEAEVICHDDLDQNKNAI